MEIVYRNYYFLIYPLLQFYKELLNKSTRSQTKMILKLGFKQLFGERGRPATESGSVILARAS